MAVSALRHHTPTQTEEDVERVVEAMRRLKCDMRPSEIADFADLPAERVASALWLAERRGLVSVRLWTLTEEGAER